MKVMPKIFGMDIQILWHIGVSKAFAIKWQVQAKV